MIITEMGKKYKWQREAVFTRTDNVRPVPSRAKRTEEAVALGPVQLKPVDCNFRCPVVYCFRIFPTWGGSPPFGWLKGERL